MRIKLTDHRGTRVKGAMRGVQIVIGREWELQRGVRAGRVPGYASVQRAYLLGLQRYVVSSLSIVLAWGVAWMWMLPRVIGRDTFSGSRSMFSLFTEWFPADNARDVSTPAIILIVTYISVGAFGGFIFVWPMFRRFLIPHAIRRTLLSRVCPACDFSLRDLQPQTDGCTVCPECGAAWKISEGAIMPEDDGPTK